MSKQNKTDKATSLLRQKLGEADNPSLPSSEPSFRQWVIEVEGILANRFGENSRQIKSFKNSFYGHVCRQGEGADYRKRQIDDAKAALNAILSEIEEFGLPETQEATTSSKPQVFIAHGGETKALEKLKSFLDALGIEPLIVEEQASEDRSVDEQVEWCLANADCVIILGTADNQNLKDGKLYPRPNVCIEIGRVQERFPGRVIYLLEEGASFPSNITEKVYERFTQENMEKAFSKAAKELKAFGIIRATTIKEP